ncbi:acyltransferase family protein [Pseudemcibacter aquimaris]|uniref:acyltransferase family protein n=1 Tax=Pseudemcibacter aquimaris TaxID=2857064 RepID=UPI00201118DB|nr:acyltransferase [Pseudemcibacter aquimaris]MCC3861462.1 acyltransferase [Pseudemcibacter aquimaris]WDU58231.1 acyltransferase [Pseudemcibacter aquimaris]
MNLDVYNKRQHFLDWVRVLAFAYLVFFHTGMMFVDWPFHIESGHDSSLLRSFMMLTSQWRMDLLFLVSGVAISVMMTKMTMASFLKQRVVKLFIPAFVATIFIVAPQPYFEALQKGIIEPGFWQFWTTQYFTGQFWDGMLTPVPTYNHMWYVVYLFAYTAVLVPVIFFANSEAGHKLLSKIENWLSRGARILWAPYILYLAVFFYRGDNDITHNIIDDSFGHFIYIYILIMGVLFVRMPTVWDAFARNRYKALALALLAYGTNLIKYHFDTPLDVIQWDLVEMIIKWSWIATILGFAKHHLNFRNEFLNYGNSIVYPFYILHQSVTIIIGYYIIDWGFNGIVEFVFILIGTYLISWGLIEAVIKRNNLIRICFGLNPKRKERVILANARS